MTQSRITVTVLQNYHQNKKGIKVTLANNSHVFLVSCLGQCPPLSLCKVYSASEIRLGSYTRMSEILRYSGKTGPAVLLIEWRRFWCRQIWSSSSLCRRGPFPAFTPQPCLQAKRPCLYSSAVSISKAWWREEGCGTGPIKLPVSVHETLLR